MAETLKTNELQVSRMAESLKGSEIIKLAGEIKGMIAKGEKIYNLTIGDFDPAVFPIPGDLKSEIIQAYVSDQTNYPAANGIAELRSSVSGFLKHYLNLHYNADEVLIAGGARPLIYAAYQALVDPEDSVVFPVPSWNNNHYTHLAHANQVFVETKPENNFMPTADDLRPHVDKAGLIAVCSPLNPTGTVFSESQLSSICDLVMEENARRREAGRKPLYLLFDQIYCLLTYGNIRHVDPVNLRPEIREYTIYIDGLSKAFAATGVRVGWAFGPAKIVGKMKSILGHVGAWAPKAEQVASAYYLADHQKTDDFLEKFKERVDRRLVSVYEGLKQLADEGFGVDVIAPQAAIYLTAKFDLTGKTTADGKTLKNTRDVTQYLLEEAKVAIVPFYAFGASEDSPWYRISVGTLQTEQIPELIESLRNALTKLS